LREHGQVEVVVVVSNCDLARRVDANSNWVVCDTFAADLAEEVALIIEHLDAVGSVVADEDFLAVIDNHAVGELKVLGTAKLVEHIAELVEDDDAHHLALHHDDPALVVDADAAGVLQDVGAELANELAVLVVDLDLVRRRPLRHNNIPGRLHHSHTVGVEQLAIPLAHLSKLELEPTLFVENLYPVIVRVGDDNVILSIYCNSTWLCELALENSKLSKLTVVDHLLPLDLAFRWVEGGMGAWDRAGELRRAGRHRGGVQGGLGQQLGGQFHHAVVGGGMATHPLLEHMGLVLASPLLAVEPSKQRV